MVEGRIYKPVVQAETCHTCNVCIRGCPAELIPEYREESESLRGAVYRNQKALRKNPLAKASGVAALPPCQEACPIHQDTRGYVGLIARGKFREAFELIREVNPLPAVCGYICHHLCEEACLRDVVDDPVPIRLLKRFVAEYDAERGNIPLRPKKKRREKILIVGSGPAGLAAANDLALLGYQVKMVEALPVLGGMLRAGIPAFRLPREILEKEIDAIKELGVEMETGRRFIFDEDGKSLKKLGFQAAFVSIGAQKSAKLRIPGENLKGVLHGVEFLRDLNLGKAVDVGERVSVIGGGNVALDVARSAVRLGARKVVIYYRRTKNEMPAIPEEVEEARLEGVTFRFLCAPIRILGKGRKAAEMECVRMKLGEPDETGRRKPVPIEGSIFRVEADTIVAAIGQEVDRSALRGFELHPDGRVRIDPETGATSVKGIFAGGDVVSGPGWAIDAISAGKKGAASIDQYLA